ncbi:MAG: hypothetical protein IJW06_00695 [Clostridia bacterium]|nr:hypothetical protein [Clostridia bacterium]
MNKTILATEIDYITGKNDDGFNPDSNLTAAQGIALASRLHAAYNGTVVKEREGAVYEHRFDFDDPSFFVDLSKRNSRNNNGVSVERDVKGEIKESMLVVDVSEPNRYGNYNPKITFNGLELDAKYYNKISVRMKIDADSEEIKNDAIRIYFKTNTNSSLSEERSVSFDLSTIADTSDWFEFEIQAGENANWKDYIRSLRVDPPMKKGVYYIDYIVLSKSEKIDTDKWYNMYVDYAVDNAIVNKNTYTSETYENEITTSQLCDLLASALPEEYYSPINNIKGIPDVSCDVKNSAVYLMLYKAGVLLGLDNDGNLKPCDAIKCSDAAAIVERAALIEKRLSGTVSADWTADSCECDLEFDDKACLDKFTVTGSADMKDGVIVLKYDETGENFSPERTPKITFKNVDLNAKDFIKLRVRMKFDFLEQPENTYIRLYYMVDGDEDFSNEQYMLCNIVRDGYVDPAGWCIAEFDFGMYHQWKGRITGLRFDPVCVAGTFIIDYVRFIKAYPLFGASHEELLANGYTAYAMLQDNGFERGFHVQHFQQIKVAPDERWWQDYCDTTEKPLWDIGPWHCSHDLWDNRDKNADKFTLTDDKGINTLKYNPEEKSLKMRLNATKVHEGKPHDAATYRWWPHLLLNQHYGKYPVDKVKNTAAADKIFMQLDMRVRDFKDTINKEGQNCCSFLLYFYFVTDKAPQEKIWYGFTLFNCTERANSPIIAAGWAPDSAAHQYMYALKMADIYGGMENSFNPHPNMAVISDEWKHIRVDITRHIERCIEWANRDLAYGVPVKKEDMFFGGCNIGFEVWGNYDCTVEIKNLDMIAYNKKENE